MDHKIVVEGDVWYIKENPDMIHVGKGGHSSDDDIRFGRGKKIAGWQDGDAVAFGMWEGKFVFSDFSRTHDSIRVPHPNQENYPGAQMGLDRAKMKYPGRLWWRKKIISFWDYPSFSQLKKVMDQLAKDWKAAGNDSINWGQWKMDIPRTEEMESSMDGSKPVDLWRGVNTLDRDTGEYVYYNTRLYSVKTVVGNKPLKGLGKPWKEKGKKISTDKGQEHLASPMKKKNMKNLTKKQKQDMWDYYKNKGKMDSADRRLYKALERSLKKEDLEIYFDGEKFIFEEKSNKKYFTLEEGSGILTEFH